MNNINVEESFKLFSQEIEKEYSRATNKDFPALDLVDDKCINNIKHLAGNPIYQVQCNTNNLKESLELVRNNIKINDNTDSLKREEVIELVRTLSVMLPHLNHELDSRYVLDNLLHGMLICNINSNEIIFRTDYTYDESDTFIDFEISNNHCNSDVIVSYIKRDIYIKITFKDDSTSLKAYIKCDASAYDELEYSSCYEIDTNDIIESIYKLK